MQQSTGPFNTDERPLACIDIETECAVNECTESDCEHALDPHKSKITLIAISDADQLNLIFKSAKDLQAWLEVNKDKYRFTYHTGKFDLKTLVVHGLCRSIALSIFQEDSNLLAFTDQDKIPDEWLDEYDRKRSEINKSRKGMKHRPAKHHSLKTLAPYFLGVEPFWEPEEGHDNEEYVLKDASYTTRLTRYFLNKLDEKSLEFYRTKFLPWTRMILEMELDGIKIDLPELNLRWAEAEKESILINEELRKEWDEHLKAYREKEHTLLNAEFIARLQTRIRQPKEKELIRLYSNLGKKLNKIEDLNFDSPTQLKWLLQERLGLDVTNLDGYESTGKEVLVRLGEKNPQVKKLLRYRQLRKLSQAFFPKYKDLQVDGRIYTNFNVTSTRTGRLSSNNPNLQQVPGHIHDLFISEFGKLLLTKDLSAIEPAILAYYSEDPELCQLVIDGIRFHSVNAIAMFELDCDWQDVKKKFPKEDKVAKTVGLAILYGAGVNRTYQTLQENGMSQYTIEDAKRIVKRIRTKYSGVWKFKEEFDKVLEKGDVIFNLLGRPMRIINPDEVYMRGLNRLIQGSASDLLLDRVYNMPKASCKPRLLVHDEAIFEVPEENADYFEKMVSAKLISFDLPTKYGNIPLRTEGKVGRSWEK